MSNRLWCQLDKSPDQMVPANMKSSLDSGSQSTWSHRDVGHEPEPRWIWYDVVYHVAICPHQFNCRSVPVHMHYAFQ